MNPSRPPLLTILCIAGFIGCFFNIFMVLAPPVQRMGPGYAVYISLATVYVAACLGGLWMMRKSAVLAYSGFALLHQGIHLFLGIWNGFVFILPAAITLAGWLYYRKMS